MSDSILQVNQIKDKGGNATGITVADTTANVNINHLTAAIEGGSLNLSTNEIVGLASSTFNGVGMILGCSYNAVSTEFEPSDASWYAQATVNHSLLHSSHYVLCIGSLGWYANSSSRGQVGIFATDNSDNSFSNSQRIRSIGSGTYSLWSGSSGGQQADHATQFAMFKPGNTNQNKYKLMMAEEGGSDFRAQVNNASQSWLIVLECTGVA